MPVDCYTGLATSTDWSVRWRALAVRHGKTVSYGTEFRQTAAGRHDEMTEEENTCLFAD